MLEERLVRGSVVRVQLAENTCSAPAALGELAIGAAARPLETAPDRIRWESNDLEG